MKTLKQHIDEALKIGKDLSEWSAYSCQPKSIDELEEIIKDRIFNEGPNCELNDIDVSLIDDMAYLFHESDFNGDISNWDVSNVNTMYLMFGDSKFNGDISKWNVSKVEDMSGMFYESKFNQDISNWQINKDCNVYEMFYRCPIKDEYKPKLPR